MSALPNVRRIVLFKHGVAYVERGGPADGPFELSFHRDEMNDVLKSLAAWVVRGDARVGAVAFERPDDPEEALEAKRLQFPPDGALTGLVAALRGRRVAVHSGSGTHAARCEGEVLGLEIPEPSKSRILLRTASSDVALAEVEQIRSIELLEAPSRADVEFLVDRSRASTSGVHRRVTVQLEGRADDLRVSYVVAAPTWRVSYRIARDADGNTRLMAWGIVHNPVDEDLEAVELVLTTGQPISFSIDLYNPKRVDRAVVEESSRAAAAPVAYERAAPKREQGERKGPRLMSKRLAEAVDELEGVDGSADGPTYVFGAALGTGPVPEVTYGERGELFEYRVASKVSLKRGGSAMVMLLSAGCEAKKERIWQDGGAPSPDLVLTFKNDTGAVLEEGPAVVYDGDVYSGEAMVPYSARGSDVRIAFAKDLGVRCRRTSTLRTVANGIKLGPDALVEEQRREEHHVLTAESDHADEVSVVFELPKQTGRTIDPSSSTPFEETASFRRFRVQVPARGRIALRVVERWHDTRRFNYDHLSASLLGQWLAERFLDDSTHEALKVVLDAWEHAAECDRRRQRAERAQEEAYVKQGKLSEQLAVLKETGPEGTLRLRYVKELEVEQDKLNAAEVEARRASAEAEASRRDAQARLRTLTQVERRRSDV